MNNYYTVVEFQNIEEDVANVVEQIDKLRKEMDINIKRGIALGGEVLKTAADSMEIVANLLDMQVDCDAWKQMYLKMRNGRIWSDICNDLLVWENDVIEQLKFIEETYGVCNLCKMRVRYQATALHFQREQKKYGFPFWNATFESISKKNRTCPVCQSMDRERMISLFIDMIQPDEENTLRILQIAPSYAMDNWLKKKEYVKYETTDLFMPDVTFQADIQDLYMVEDESYDIILCSHILEHVEDDRKAMRELKRVLKKDGACIFLVPLIVGLDQTDEEFGLSAEENWRRFGQDDHVRLYAREDFLDRLVESGYRVHILGKDYFGKEVWRQSGLSDIHCLYVATKNDIGIGVEPYQSAREEEELVSVIIPTYNRGYCIEHAISSVLNQTWRNLEVIIVDDASTDNTLDVVENFHDSRINYIKLGKNSGANHARNVGIQNAKGKYVAFNDSDDQWLPQKLEKQMKLMSMLERTDGSYACVYCVLTKYENGKVVEIAPQLEKCGENTIGDVYDFLQAHMFISTQTLLIKKDVLEEVGYFNENIKRLQDWELLLRIAQKYKFSLVQENLVDAYIQKECITKNIKGWIETVFYAIQLHNMAESNREAYKVLIRVAIGMMQDSHLEPNYIMEKMTQVENDRVFPSSNIYYFKQVLGLESKHRSELKCTNIELESIVSKLSELDQKVCSISQSIQQNERLLNEILWSQVFNSSRCACKWLKDDIAFWPGRWGVGYQYMYVISRFLNEIQPKSILETGLGQSTRLIGSYVKWMSAQAMCNHLVLEHDTGWIETFLKSFQLSDATKIVQRDLGYVQLARGEERTYTYVYQNLQEVLPGKKFDFISIDAPYGTDERYGYSRIDILDYLPNCLEKDFCIVLDDYNRWGEKNTVEYMKKILQQSKIEFSETIYKGTQDLYMLVSPSWKFLCTL